ncbi:alpha/beta fold hydrolase [Allokutzneria sp. A3M-2-11 16]|uniref:thioesterase II family protein n=1 Tax=Allokutzneria sp. A3M-2-11 16 TaxID=2962043 RepID=UPI0020B6F2C1|nr:alpha/beta fold hydrolase [Allokutzneria sp. A3M-2-11 16]MCP3803127.1 alpha/beta fold hydrolase [Allokutzneria sp. A3M-2-11 16]
MTEPLHVFCVPHAGGSARTFLKWQRTFPPELRIVPLEIAGKGRRSLEPRHATVREVADDLVQRIETPGRYAIFGHSMGGLIAYEMARSLAPEFVVVAATRPPHLIPSDHRASLASLPDDELLDAMASAGTVPESVRNSPMRDLFVPNLRADLALVATYRPAPAPAPLPVDLHVWHGTEDPTTPAPVMAEWRRYTARECRMRAFTGDHFFPHSAPHLVAEALSG